MADLFGNSTLPGWQMYTPTSYSIAAAPAAEALGRNFTSAYESAQSNKRKDASLAEEKRQFDTLHPAMPGPRDASTSTAAKTDEMMNGPTEKPYTGFGTPGFSWDNEPKVDDWKTHKFNTPAEAISAIANAPDMPTAMSIMGANVQDWGANPTYNQAAWMAAKIPAEKQKTAESAARVVAGSLATKVAVQDETLWHQELAKLGNDPDAARARAELVKIPMVKNPDGTMTVSPAQWSRLADFQKAQLDNRKASAEASGLVHIGFNPDNTPKYGLPKVSAVDPNAKFVQEILPNGLVATRLEGSKVVHFDKPGETPEDKRTYAVKLQTIRLLEKQLGDVDKQISKENTGTDLKQRATRQAPFMEQRKLIADQLKKAQDEYMSGASKAPAGTPATDLNDPLGLR